MGLYEGGEHFEYIFSMGAMASYGYSRSSIMASNLGWSMKPNVFVKSIVYR